MKARNFNLPFSRAYGCRVPGHMYVILLGSAILNICCGMLGYLKTAAEKNRHQEFEHSLAGGLGLEVSPEDSQAVSKVTSHPCLPRTVPDLAPEVPSPGKLLSLR